jgi:hypothetical protein
VQDDELNDMISRLRTARTDFGHLLGKYCVLTVSGPQKLYEYAPKGFSALDDPIEVMGRVVGRETVGIWFEPTMAVMQPNSEGRVIPYHILVRWEYILTATTNPLVNDFHHDKPDWQGLKPDKKRPRRRTRPSK